MNVLEISKEGLPKDVSGGARINDEDIVCSNHKVREWPILAILPPLVAKDADSVETAEIGRKQIKANKA